MTTEKLVSMVDEAIARSNEIIEKAISDGIIKRANSNIELYSQEKIRKYFEENWIFTSFKK